MQVISIFIAGAKNLKEQRLGLKALTNDLNAKYAKKGWDVSLNMNSYENFGEKQSDYNDFILNQANIIIFVLKDRIGQKTEDEYLLATNAYKLNGHPEVITFLHAFEERTPEIDHIEQLVNSATDTYYVDYTNTEDLIAKAKDRINTFVENQINQNCSWLKRIWKKALLFLGGILALVLFLLTFILFDSTNYLVVLTPDPPVSIVNSGMGKDFISQQIVDGVKEIGDSSQYKFDRIVKEARQQSGSPVETKIESCVNLAGAVQIWKSEAENLDDEKKIAVVLYERSLSTVTIREACEKKHSPQKIALFCGSEGGLSPQEVKFLSESGFTAVHLKTNILRCETAALYGISALQSIVF
jgi:hypothetical protein